MAMTDETDDSGGVILDGPFDPDAQATVTDFIDYTEYLPADLIRSLTLIRGLDDRYLDSAQGVHQLTQIYGQLPELPADQRPSAIELRKDISLQLDRAINARESAYAEACRLYDVVDRHFDRLGCIRQKLEALPKPPSSEPSPVPEPTPKRARTTKKPEGTNPTRITLRVDNRRPRDHKRRKYHMGLDGAGFDPDSPIASTEQSDAETDLATIIPKPSRPKKEKPRRQSSGNGQSTAQALAQLKPPPEDAKLGSEDLPWLRLTEWEMTRLRKKMKKNAVWQPSEVMIHRELALANRGWEAYRLAKAFAEETGAEFIDCDNIEQTRRGEAAKDLEETKLSNRGMKLNEAKKLKREQLAREQALMDGDGVLPKAIQSPAQPTPAANRSSRKRKREEAMIEVPEAAIPEPAPEPVPTAAPISAPTPAPVPATSSRSGARRRSSRGAIPTSETGNKTVTLIKTRVSPPAEAPVSPPLPSPTGSRRSNRSFVLPITTPTPPVTRPSSRRSVAAASIETGTLNGIHAALTTNVRDQRIKSATPTHKPQIRESSHAPSVQGPDRRRKRPAPGPISSGQDGGAAVSYGRRKAKPGKKRINVRDSQDVRVDEDGVLEQIDVNEPRYCLCGDVSFGTMICCENQDCDREWFHLDCVGLTEVPSRTAKWYCPQCRIKLHKGEDGIIKGGSRR